jgi:FG-GAP-like repeat
MSIKLKICTLFVLICGVLNGQNTIFPSLQVPVLANGQTLKNAFSGGLNAAQFSTIDLNRDGLDDLFVFDRVGNKVLTFLNRGTRGQQNYVYAPEYACDFPTLNDYALLRDYNRDGIMDIFCASAADQEMQVYRGQYVNNRLQFVPYRFNYPGCRTCDTRFVFYPDEVPGIWNNLAIAQSDIPDINDVDGDGDMDILTFEASVGGQVWWLRNMSVERGFRTDSLIFRLEDRCWGRMYEVGLRACYCNLSPSASQCAAQFTGTAPIKERNGIHPGSTLLSYDDDGDGDKELILGDVSFTCLNMLVNGGSRTAAWMNDQSTAFPPSEPVNIPVFPAAFYLDANNDGRKDLIVAPNSRTIGEDRAGTWWYENRGTGPKHNFELASRRFLTETMIDLGSFSQPVLVDVNNDNLLDLVVGATFFDDKISGFLSQLYLYINTGTFSEPRFTLTDSDWLGMSEFAPNDYEFTPAFGDLDNDGDLDAVVGSLQGILYYYQNIAGRNQPMRFQRSRDPMWESMDVGTSSSPAIYDLDNDNRPDLIVGERNSNVNFFKNTGSPTEPRFTDQPQLTNLGRIDLRRPDTDIGFSAPVIFQTPEGTRLALGSLDGIVLIYSNLAATNQPYTLVSNRFGNIDDGNRSRPTFGDLDDDGILEMVTGNSRGGLHLYKTQLAACTPVTSTTRQPAAVEKLGLWPNPATDRVQLSVPFEGAVRWEVFDALGRLTASGDMPDVGNVLQLDTSTWPAGMYRATVTGSTRRAVGTIVVKH